MTEQHPTERHAQRIIDSATDFAIIGLALDGTIVSWNSGAANILGWSASEAVGRPRSIIFTNDDLADGIPAAEMSAAIRTGRGIDERWHVRKDGSRFWANGEMMPLRDENGGLKGYVKILRDRSEQHEAVAALNRSEDRYRTLHDAMDEGFCLIEVSCDDDAKPVDYRFLEVNAAFERQTGLVDAAGSWMRDLAPEHEQHWFDTYARIARTGEAARFVLPARALGRTYDVFAFRVGDPADRMVAILFSDITGRRLVEDRLKESEEHLQNLNAALRSSEANLRLLLDTISEGFYAVDRDGVTTTCNAAFLRMMGFARAEDAIGRKLHPMIHHTHPDGSDYAVADCPIYLCAAHGTPAHVRDELFFPLEGKPLWVEYQVTPIMENGELRGAICTFQDVSERRIRHEQQAAAERRRLALAEFAEVLRNSREPVDMAAAAAELVGRTLAASAVGFGRIDGADETLIIERDWTIKPRFSVAGRHPMRNYGSYIDDLLASRMVVIGDVATDPRTRDHQASFAAVGVNALMNAPVVEHGRLAAILCVLADTPRNWTDGEVAFVQEVAERTRVAIERRWAESRLAYSERLRFGLANLSDRLRGIADPAEMQTAASEIIGQSLDVGRVGYGLVEADGETFTVPTDWTAPGFPSLAGVYRLDDYGLYAADLRAGSTVIITDVRLDPRTSADPEPLIALSVASLINHPVIEKGRIVAVLYANDAEPRTWREEEVAFVREAGDRLRQATERRRAEVDLQHLNDRLESEIEVRTAERDRMWNSSPDLMVVATTEGFYQRVNPAWTDVLGYASGELLGLYATDLVHPDDVGTTEDALKRLRSESLPMFENRLRHKDGGYRWIQWLATPSDTEFFATGRHVTEAKEAQQRLADAEAQLRQSQKMEAVGQLTGGLAHDFNNLLTAVTGGLELLGHRLAAGQYDKVERYMSMAQTGAQRAAALTQRLLAFSRRQTLAPTAVDADRLVIGMMDIIDRTLGPSIELKVEATAGLWPVLVDAPQLENALLNLCINARDAMPDGGRLTIETGNKHLDQRAALAQELPTGDYVSLCVSDTGTGMPPEVIERVFGPFFTTKPLGEGTGLGLSMIYGFVRQSGGQVRIYSEVGQGTTMCLYLPRLVGVHDLEEDGNVTTERMRAEHGQTVLLVEDEMAIRELVAEVLGEAGYRVLSASTGPAGVALLQSQERIDLLITDVGLPGGLNGRQVADAGRAVRSDLKVLFVTGYAANAAVGAGHLEPGMSVLTKPFNILELERRVAEILAT